MIETLGFGLKCPITNKAIKTRNRLDFISTKIRGGQCQKAVVGLFFVLLENVLLPIKACFFDPFAIQRYPRKKKSSGIPLLEHYKQVGVKR